ncbi:hypothetical protein F4803DRAFT_328917 [Xylaria telfairii]|nr:hypothetical protein F4803DRAFT_328917 [Xylaria telfairii]
METQSGRSDLPCSNAIEGHAAHGFDPVDGVKSYHILKSCTTCGSAAETRCPTCGTWYCSRQCLKKDWVHHRPICGPLKNEFNGDNAPVNHVRAILFPRDAVKPTWVWVHLRALDASITTHLGIPAQKGFLTKPRNKLAVKDINKSLTHRPIGHGIRQFTAPRARFQGPDGCNINKSIFALADPGSLRTYFGSAIFLGFRTYLVAGNAKIYYEDASPRDLRMIIEWYYTRPENPFISESNRLPIESYVNPGEKVMFRQAVKLNCVGDQKLLSELSGKVVAYWQEVDVLSKDVRRNRIKSDFAAMAGLPWVIERCYDMFDPIADRGKELDWLYNKHGSCLVPQTKRCFQQWRLDNIDGWVLPSHLPSKYCGSLLVMHKDSNISAPYVIGFHDFVTEGLNIATPHMVYHTEQEGVGRGLISGRDLERVINKENFESYFMGRATLLIALCDMKSPYNEINGAKANPVPLAVVEEEEAKEEVNGERGKNSS